MAWPSSYVCQVVLLKEEIEDKHEAEKHRNQQEGKHKAPGNQQVVASS